MQAQCSGVSSSIRSTSKVAGFEYHRLYLWMVVLRGYQRQTCGAHRPNGISSKYQAKNRITHAIMVAAE